ncbi:hypothetical protein C0992_010797 [Termitomyces sp. T32_za158]|nr:hypothetical protein C0992_010797 [Termitomyces sp. T32_za158]
MMKTMALEWPDHENEMKKQTKAKAKKRDDFIVNDSDDEVLRPKKKQEQGLLFQVEFFRIILDEAQSIRNRRTTTLAVSRLQTIITTFLLRRMKDTTMDGKRLIELPERKVSLVRLQFSKEERDVYKMVEAGAQANFNRFLKAGTVLKNYTQVLVLLLRLRQVCSHPLLIQEGGAAFVSDNPANDEESGKDEELSRACRLVSSEFVAIMKAKLKASAMQRIEAEKQSADATVEDEECPICFDAFTDAVVTPCTHIFCRECILDVLNTPPAVNPNEPNRYKVNERPCPTCRGALCAEKLFPRRAFLPSDAELSSDDVKVEDDVISDREGKGRVNARPEWLRENASSKYYNDDDDEKDTQWLLKKGFGHRNALVVLDSDDEETPEEREVIFGMGFYRSAEAIKLIPKFVASTKMKYMMERLSTLFEEHPDEKAIEAQSFDRYVPNQVVKRQIG